MAVHLANSNPDPAEERLPRLSIIIPTLNEAAHIGALLRMLRDGGRHHLEVIVVDGGSTDATCEIARALADRIIMSPAGRAIQMNEGASAATGDILLFLHADTRPPDAYRAHLENGFWRSPHQWGRFDIRLSGRRAVFRVIETLINLRSRLTGIATGDQGIFVRRTLFRKLGGFAPVPLMEDVELSARLRRTTRPYCIRGPLVTSSRKWEREGVVRTIFTMWSLRIAYWLGRDPALLARRYYGPTDSGERSTRFPRSRVLLFCRTPEPGQTKTRLIPSLGAEGAASLHAQMIQRTVDMVLDSGLAPLQIWVKPHPGHSFFDRWRVGRNVVMRTQVEGDLGRIMFEAARDALGSAESVLLVGTDVPALKEHHLEECLIRLKRRDDAVLIPSDDGGYVLLGLRRAVPRLFEEVAWGTDRVCDETRARLRELKWRWSELPPLWDVDCPEDLERLADEEVTFSEGAPDRSR